MIGVCVDPEGVECLLTEASPEGCTDLLEMLNYIHENEIQISQQTFNSVALQIAQACLELTSHGVLHRSLAARSVVVHSFNTHQIDKVHVKLADYGIEPLKPLEVSMRWAAPEMIDRRRCSAKSMVHSFGTFMWELWSVGKVPFGCISEERHVARAILAGEQLSRPAGFMHSIIQWNHSCVFRCPSEVFDLMRSCWATNAKVV